MLGWESVKNRKILLGSKTGIQENYLFYVKLILREPEIKGRIIVTLLFSILNARPTCHNKCLLSILKVYGY